MIIDPYRFAVAANSPWIAGQINTSGSRLVAVSPDGIQWSTAPTYATGLTGAITQIHYSDGLVIASASGVAPRVSFDGGQTWNSTTNLGNFQCDGLVKSGSFWVTGVSTGKRSSDGLTWTNEIGVAIFEPTIFGGAVVCGCSSNSVARSTDDGDNWSFFGTLGGLADNRYVVATASHIMMGAPNRTGSVIRSSTGLSGSFASKAVPLTAGVAGFAGMTAGDCLIISTSREMAYSNDSGDNWTSNGTIGDSGDTFPANVNCANYGDGAWIVNTYNAGSNVSKIWRATSVSGPFTKVGEFSGANLAGVRYIGP